MFKLNCLEGLTALAIGAGAVCAGHFDAGLTAGAAIGLSAVFTRFRENAEAQGLDTNELLESMRLGVFRELDRYDDTQEIRDARVEADSAMAALLTKVTITRSMLARTSTENREKSYPEYVAEVIADQLAALDPTFACPDHPDSPVSVQRDFALRVVRRALEVAMENSDFAIGLTLDLTIETNRKLADVDQKLDGMPERIVTALRASGNDRSRGLAEDLLLALARQLDPAIDGVPQAVLELSRTVESFVRIQVKASTGTNLGELVDSTLSRVAELNQQKRFDIAAQEIDLAWRKLADEGVSVQARMNQIAELGVEQARVRYDASAMTHWLIEREGGAKGATFLSLIELARSYRDKQDETNGIIALDVSSRLAKRALILTDVAEKRAIALEITGLSLSNLGAKSSSDKAMQNLHEALKAFRQAELIWTKDANSEKWARLKMYEGRTTHAIGMRLCGFPGLRALRKGIKACEEGLSVYAHSPSACGRADLQAMLSAMLLETTSRIQGWKALYYIGRAINSLIDASAIYRDLAVEDKGTETAVMLATTYIMVGSRTSDPTGSESVDRGVRMLGELLVRCDPVIKPQQWANVSFNYAAGLVSAAAQRPECARSMLLEALRHYNSALTVNTIDKDQVAWANIKIGVARTLTRLADISEEPARYLQKAQDSLTAALGALSPQDIPYAYADAQEGLVEIKSRIAKLQR